MSVLQYVQWELIKNLMKTAVIKLKYFLENL